MFFLELLMSTKKYKLIQKKFKPKFNTVEIGWIERTIGILFWPLCLGIFLYNFFKEIFK